MYEDAPQDLVHDLIAEAVFGDHPLGRPVIGTAEVISSIPRDAIARYHDSMYVPANIVVAAAGNIEHDRVVELVERALERRKASVASRLERAAAARAGAAAAAALPAEGHRAVPRVPRRARASRGPTAAGSPRRCSTRSSAARRRRGSSRRSARSAGWRTPSTRSSRSTPTPGRSASISARARTTSPTRSRSRPSRSPTSPPGTFPTRELERAKENLKGRILLSMESTSTRMNRLGKSLITDSELLSLDRIVAEIDAVDAASVCRARRARCSRPSGCRRRASGRTRSGSSRRSSASRPTSRARREASSSTARRGKVGSVLGAGARGRRHALVDALDGADAMVDFTRPDAVAGERARRASPPACRASSARRAGTPSEFRDAPVTVFYAPNFAIGAVLMMRFAAEAAQASRARGDRRAAPCRRSSTRRPARRS